ncbi:MAG TPA: lytic transglycosylase domain-containing protein [Thioploca sp.]|nr:lytic transglycosylase domain-containing protein [Thioploca sp.]
MKPFAKTVNAFMIGIAVGMILGVYVGFHFDIVRKPYFGSSDYRGIAWEIARQHHIEVSLLFAIVQQESKWNPKAISPKGAIGLMQIMPATGDDFCGLTEQQLLNPRLNLECGTAYFAKQFKAFGSVRLALCAYNAGPARVRKLGKCPDFKETTRYVHNILKNWNGGK